MRRATDPDIEIISKANRRAFGKNLERAYPVDEKPMFEDLLSKVEIICSKVNRH